MKSIKIFPQENLIEAIIDLPGSLSYTIRALNIAAMIKGPVKIINALKSDDTQSMITILKQLGIKIVEDQDNINVIGSIEDVKAQEFELNIGISGRTARTILATLCLVPGVKIVNCQKPFKKRPVKDLVDGLIQLGAEIEYLENEGFLPVKIVSHALHSGTVRIKGEKSSQYISALLMIAPLIGDVTIEVTGEQSSKPFIDITMDIMKKFGVYITNNNYQKYLAQESKGYKNISTYKVEPDAISASYFFAIAALTQSKITIIHLSPESAQGDVHFVDLLEQMGAEVEKNSTEKSITVKGTNKLHGINIDMNNMPDTVQTLAVLAAFAKGKTAISGISHLNIKETDRIAAPARELEKMGIKIDKSSDTLTIYGGNPHEAEIETYGDHRMAMAFAVAGSKIPGIVIKNPDVVSKSFPDFWKKLEEIGVKYHYEN